jgi:hypothetical protein
LQDTADPGPFLFSQKTAFPVAFLSECDRRIACSKTDRPETFGSSLFFLTVVRCQRKNEKSGRKPRLLFHLADSFYVGFRTEENALVIYDSVILCIIFRE